MQLRLTFLLGVANALYIIHNYLMLIIIVVKVTTISILHHYVQIIISLTLKCQCAAIVV